MKKLINSITALLLIAIIIVGTVPFAGRQLFETSNLMAEAAGNSDVESVVDRYDGKWLFPLDKKYFKEFNDWAGCNSSPSSTGNCYFHGSSCRIGCSADHKSKDGYGHNGIDIGALKGTKVYASASGKYIT